MGVATALVLAPLAGAPCGPCGPMDEAMDCCDHASEPAGAPEGCPGDLVGPDEWSPVAADLSAPAPVHGLVACPARAPIANLLPGSRALTTVLGPPLPSPHLYILHAVFLI